MLLLQFLAIKLLQETTGLSINMKHPPIETEKDKNHQAHARNEKKRNEKAGERVVKKPVENRVNDPSL